MHLEHGNLWEASEAGSQAKYSSGPKRCPVVEGHGSHTQACMTPEHRTPLGLFQAWGPEFSDFQIQETDCTFRHDVSFSQSQVKEPQDSAVSGAEV